MQISKDLRPHHWLTIARKYGMPRPAKLNRAAVTFAENERREWMQRTLRLDASTSRRDVRDRWGNTIILDRRIIDKALLSPDRTPYIAWATFALCSAIELWCHKDSSGREDRRYYLAAITQPDKKSIALIVGEDDVAFNVIPFDPPYAEQLRTGNLLQSVYDPETTFCTPHDCCNDILEIQKALDQAIRAQKEAVDRLADLRKRNKNKARP